MRKLIGLHQDVSVVEDEQQAGAITLRRPDASGRLGVLPQGVCAALHRLRGEPTSEDELAGEVMEIDGQRGVLRWQMLLRKLGSSGLLEHSVEHGGRVVATLRAIGSGAASAGGKPDPNSRIKL